MHFNAQRERELNIMTLVGGMGITPNMVETLRVDAYASDGRQARDKVLAMIGKLNQHPDPAPQKNSNILTLSVKNI